MEDKTIIIGLQGRAGCGKGEVANIIMSHYNTVKVFPLASELKRIARDEFGWDGKKDDSGRRLLQRLGTECGRMYGGEDFWVNKWQDKIQDWRDNVSWSEPNYPIVVCDDVRFDNEAKRIRELGGCIINIVGRSFDMGENNNHPSERGIDHKYVDYCINNNSTLNKLKEQVILTVNNIINKEFTNE